MANTMEKMYYASSLHFFLVAFIRTLKSERSLSFRRRKRIIMECVYFSDYGLLSEIAGIIVGLL